MDWKAGRGGKTVLRILLAAVGIFLFFRYLLPCVFPFLLAFLTAAVCEPAVKFLSEKLHLRRGIASALCVFIVLASLVGFFLLVVVRLADEAVNLINELPRLTAGLPALFEKLEGAFQRVSESVPASVRKFMNEALNDVAGKAGEIPASLSAWALRKLSSAAAGTPGTVLAIGTYAIGSFFISGSFPSVCAFLLCQIPPRAREIVRRAKTDIFDSVGRWLRAEATLLGVTFLELAAAFLFMRVEYGAVVALLIALIDALPVFGTGVVLLPWAAVSLLTGDVSRAVSLLATYLVVTVVHECLEPKLIGDQFGVPPAAALLAMYTGFKLLGVPGMVLFPFLLMLLNKLNAKGYVRLWKIPEKQEK